MFKRIKRRIAMWFFARNIGRLAKAYSKLSQQAERAASLMENFGKKWQAAQQWVQLTDGGLAKSEGESNTAIGN